MYAESSLDIFIGDVDLDSALNLHLLCQGDYMILQSRMAIRLSKDDLEVTIRNLAGGLKKYRPILLWKSGRRREHRSRPTLTREVPG